MPLFEFVCQKCDREQEILVRGEEKPECDACGSRQLTRLLSVPAAHSVAHSASTSGPPSPPTGSCGSGCGCFPG